MPQRIFLADVASAFAYDGDQLSFVVDDFAIARIFDGISIAARRGAGFHEQHRKRRLLLSGLVGVLSVIVSDPKYPGPFHWAQQTDVGKVILLPRPLDTFERFAG
jgi:hypothetical protein